jgi:hypothetical protein
MGTEDFSGCDWTYYKSRSVYAEVFYNSAAACKQHAVSKQRGLRAVVPHGVQSVLCGQGI